MTAFDYGSVYTAEFFNEADGIGEWHARKLKYGDALAAIGYAFGLPSFEAIRSAVPFDGNGGAYPSDGLTAADQIARLARIQTRAPKGVLEIGCGRGEVSVTLAHFDYPVQAIEPSPGAASWLQRTAQHFFDLAADGYAALPLRLLNAPVHVALNEIDWTAVDTVIMVESLEHILADDFEPAYAAIVENLRKNKGRFIVTNWIDYHPIQVGWYAAGHVHCRRTDDALYDEWSKNARSVAFRQGAHLVLDY